MPWTRALYTVVVVGWDCFFRVTFAAAFDPKGMKGSLDLQLLVTWIFTFPAMLSLLDLRPKPHMMHTLFILCGLAIIVSSE